MIPLRDENPTELTPFVTVALIAANVAVWLLVQGGGSSQALQASVVAYGSYPCEITGVCAASGLGWASVLTSMFLHGSWEHLLGNMLFLWVFGNNIEDSMGHLRFIIFYLLCGAFGGAAHVLLSPSSAIPAVGASGAISGVMGAYVLLYPHVRVRTWIPPFFLMDLKALFLLGYWFVLQLGMGLADAGTGGEDQGGVAVWAHVGGFIAGLLLIYPFRKRELVAAKRAGVKLPSDKVAGLEW